MGKNSKLSKREDAVLDILTGFIIGFAAVGAVILEAADNCRLISERKMYSSFSKYDLQKRLDIAIRESRFEDAIILRDLINAK
jgi:hypothetical protein